MERFDLARLKLSFDAGDPAGFRVGLLRPGPQAGAQQTGMSLYELPPGEAVCPYHYEHSEEEWLVVLDGEASVRHPGGVDVLGPRQAAFFARGPSGAHQVRNDGDVTLRVLMFSSVTYPGVTVYPDSDKVGVYTGDPAEDVIVPRGAAVDYYEGEVPRRGGAQTPRGSA